MAQDSSLSLAGYALSSDNSKINIGEKNFMLLSPCITSVPAATVTLYMSLLSKHWDARERG